MGTISELIGPLYYLYDLCTCSFLDQSKFEIEFSDKNYFSYEHIMYFGSVSSFWCHYLGLIFSLLVMVLII